MEVITATTSPISVDDAPNFATVSVVVAATSTAVRGYRRRLCGAA